MKSKGELPSVSVPTAEFRRASSCSLVSLSSGTGRPAGIATLTYAVWASSGPAFSYRIVKVANSPADTWGAPPTIDDRSDSLAQAGHVQTTTTVAAIRRAGLDRARVRD